MEKSPIKYIFRYGALASALLLTVLSYGQTDSLKIYVPDTTFFQRKSEADSLQILQQEELKSLKRADKDNVIDTTSKFGIVLSLDYGKLLTIPLKFETKYEGSAGLIIFRNFLLEGVYGSAELDPTGAYKNTEYYTIEGAYYKAGLQYRFILNPANPRDFLYLGVSYAMSSYSDRGKFVVGSEIWEDYEETFGSDDMQASWTEVHLVTEAYLSKKTDRFLIGAKFSLRIMGDFESREDIPVYAVPGYGRTFDKTVPAVNLFIKYKLAF